MYKFLTKNGQTIAFGVGAFLVIVFYALVLSNGNFETFTNMDAEGVKDPERYKFGMFNFGLIATIVLMIIGAVIAAGFGVYQIATNFKNSIVGLVGLAVLGIIFAIGYFTGTVETEGPVHYAAQKFSVSDTQRKIINGSLYSGLILIALAVLGIIVSEIRNFFK